MLATAGTPLKQLATGLTRWLVVEEHQKADAFPSAPDLAKDVVTVYAAKRSLLLLHCLPFSRLPCCFARSDEGHHDARPQLPLLLVSIYTGYGARGSG